MSATTLKDWSLTFNVSQMGAICNIFNGCHQTTGVRVGCENTGNYDLSLVGNKSK